MINVGDGNIAQVVDGDVRPVELCNGMLQLYMPAPNLPPQPPLIPMPTVAQPFNPLYGPTPMPSAPPGFGPQSSAATSQMPTARELRLLEQFHVRLEQELKDLNRNEVLQRNSLNPRKKEEIVKRRVQLTEQIDQSRRSIVDAKSVLEGGHVMHHQAPNNADQAIFPPTQMLPELSPMPREFGGPLHPSPPSNVAPNVFVDQQEVRGRQGLQPQLPEFVPRQFRSGAAAPTGDALRERSSNIAIASNKSSTGDHGSTDTIKAFNHSGMGLDGAVQHPRRSHAVAIRDPNDAEAKSRTSLNPASPSYQPKRASTGPLDGTDHSEVLNFMPSPSLIAQMEKLVRSPSQNERHFKDSVGSNQQSETSVNTADFFPQSTHEYSSRSNGLGRDGKNLSWMPKDGDPEPSKAHTTPVKMPNKFIYNNDSPAEGYWVDEMDPVKSNDVPDYHAQDKMTEGPNSRYHARESTVATDDNRYGRGRKSVPTPLLLNEVSERTASLANPVAVSTAYRQGFETGLRQDIMDGNKDENYRRGYRDGLVKSMRSSADSAVLMKDNGHAHGADPDQMQTSASGDIRGDIRGLGQALTNTPKKSQPFSNGSNGQTSPVPGPPTNSLATTPTHARSARKGSSSATLDSPAARADFEAQPNVCLSAGRTQGTQTSTSLRGKQHDISPTKRRNFAFPPTEANPSGSKMRDFGESFEQQRFAKGKTSIFQANDQARGYLASQYDGSRGDEKPSDDQVSMATPASPNGQSGGNAGANGSPVRRKASAAVANMRQIAGISGKKDGMTNPTSPSSPEKKAWREKWTKNFRQNKKEDVDAGARQGGQSTR